MRFVPLAFLALPALLAKPAAAHPGHIADVAGHDHWVFGAGLAAIAGAALVAWLKGGRRDGEAHAEERAEEEEAAGDEEARA
jgi:hypothetical protein